MLLIKIIITLLFVANAQATEMVGALSAGMGGTGRAAAESTDSLFLNPAGIALMGGFYSGMAYQSGFTAKDVSRNTYGITMTDATKGVFLPGSFGYRRHKINLHGQNLNEDEFKVGLGYRLTPRLSLGLGGSYLRAQNDAGQKFKQHNLDFGMLMGLQPNWGLSLTGENLIEQSEVIPLGLKRSSRVALGTQYVFRRAITFRYESLLPLYIENTQLLGHRFGLGVLMRKDIYLNGGFSVDDAAAQNWSSIGVAWKGPRLKIAYSFQKEGRSDLGTRHLVDLWVDI